MPVLNPPEPYFSNPTQLLALCIWREARGEPYEAKLGVAWTVKNRCLEYPAQGFGKDIPHNILKPWAFSSFMEGDPNSTKYPAANDPSWLDSVKAAESVEADPVGGAVFYFSRPILSPPKAWGAVHHTATVFGLQFYRCV